MVSYVISLRLQFVILVTDTWHVKCCLAIIMVALAFHTDVFCKQGENYRYFASFFVAKWVHLLCLESRQHFLDTEGFDGIIFLDA